MLGMQTTARVQEEKQAKGVNEVCMNLIIFKIDFVNWWTYWKKGYDSREIHLFWLCFTTNGFMENSNWIRIDIHLLNLGIIIRI